MDLIGAIGFVRIRQSAVLFCVIIFYFSHRQLFDADPVSLPMFLLLILFSCLFE